MSAVVVRQGRMYLDSDGFFRAHCAEDAMQFDSPDAAVEFLFEHEGIEIESYTAAVAREDREYADQLFELRS